MNIFMRAGEKLLGFFSNKKRETEKEELEKEETEKEETEENETEKSETEKNESEKKQIPYLHLMPVDEIKDGKHYFEALDWALKSDNINNIAISGPYSSGKSSIINSYLKQQSKLKYLNISLANFDNCNSYRTSDDNDNKNGNSIKNTPSLEYIERALLTQLFYHEKSSTIPQSRYIKIHKLSNKKIVIGMSLVAVLGGIATFIFEHAFFTRILLQIAVKDYLLYNLKPVFRIPLFSLFVAGSGYIIFLAVRKIIGKLKNVEINIWDRVKISKESDNSENILDKNMDEIIYFFEATEYNIVFIEDLDRFDNVGVFTKLREINTILNNTNILNNSNILNNTIIFKKNKKRRSIKFVYAISDAFFTNAEQRNKFFDFIIPVVPYITQANAAGEFKDKVEYIKQRGVKAKISDDFYDVVSMYILDMRALIEIINEFVFYKQSIDKDGINGLEDEKLMAMMILKTLYPKEFSQLEADRGDFLYAIRGKMYYIRKITKDYNDFRSELTKKINDFNEKEELRNALIQMTDILSEHYKKKFDGFSKYNNDYIFTVDTFLNSGIPSFFFNDKDIRMWFIDDKVKNSSVLLSDLPDGLASDVRTLIKRCSEVESRMSSIKKDIETKSDMFEKERESLKNMSIAQFINQIGEEKVFEDKESILNNKLLISLLKNGYLDEKYSMYINYSRPNSESKLWNDDYKFVRNVKADGYWEYFSEVELSDLDTVYDELSIEYFSRRKILNYYFVEYLINKKSGSDKTNALVEYLLTGNGYVKEFIENFLNYTKNKAKFLNTLTSKNDKLWNYMTSANSDFKIKNREKLFIDILMNVKMPNLIRMKKKDEDFLNEFTANTDWIAQIKENQADKLVSVLSALNIKLTSIEKIPEGPVFDKIWYNNLIAGFKLRKDLQHNIITRRDNSLEVLKELYHESFEEDEEIKELDFSKDESVQEAVDKIIKYDGIQNETKEVLLRNLKLKKLSIISADYIADNTFQIDEDKVRKAFELTSKKMKMMANHLPDISDEFLAEILQKLGDEYASLAVKKKHKVKLDDTPDNEMLMLDIKKRGWITSYDIDDERKIISCWVKKRSNTDS